MICFHRVIHFSNLFEERFSIMTPLKVGGREGGRGRLTQAGRKCLTRRVARGGRRCQSAVLPFDGSKKGSKGRRVHG